jgi:hypothetical protein
VSGIVQAFRRYPVVAIGEQHSIRQVGDFYDALIRDPEFQKTVHNIVIEFASRRSQAILDRYINGEDVPLDELQQVWRNTTKVFAFESPIYAHLLASVREANAHLLPGKRMRVLAGDTWIDWSTVTNHEQWERYQPNNLSFAEVIEKEVLARGQSALVILGSGHLMKIAGPHREPDTTTLVERAYPRSIYVVIMSFRMPLQSGLTTPPALLPWPRVKLPDGQEIVAGDHGDALLYLGPSPTPAPPDWEDYRNDPRYLKELDRRARIEWGCGFDLERFREGLPHCQ